MIKECSEDACGMPAHTRGLCSRHYQTKRNRGEIDIRSRSEKWCSEADCSGPHYARGLCRSHYQARRIADPTWTRPRVPGAVSLHCEVRGCGQPTMVRNLCQRHNSRWQSYPELRSLEALALFEEDRLCPLCLLKPAAVVDHDHATGKIRGHLCSGCNTALGKMHDDLGIMHRMIRYVETAGWMSA